MSTFRRTEWMISRSVCLTLRSGFTLPTERWRRKATAAEADRRRDEMTRLMDGGEITLMRRQQMSPELEVVAERRGSEKAAGRVVYSCFRSSDC